MMLAVLAAALAAAEPDPPAAFAEIDRTFVCPEALPSDQAKSGALRDFMSAAAKAAPKGSIVQIMQLRRRLLEKHGCTQTLRSLDASEARVRAGDVLEQAWFPLGASPTAQLSFSATYVKPYVDPRDPTVYAVETYTRLDFRAPAETNVTHTRYDTVVSHNVFYCGKASYALVENDYFLSGREVLKDPSPPHGVGGSVVYDISPIVKGSFNEVAARAVCAAEPGGTAKLARPTPVGRG